MVIMTGLLVLSSCASLRDILSNRSEPNQDSVTPGTSAPISVDNDSTNNFYKPTSHRYANDELSKTWDVATWRSVGEQKLLVVPVKFTDSPTTYGNDATVKETIRRGFFGQSNETGWESLSSYYHKSSFGKLTITGEVLDPFNMGMKTTDLEDKPKTDTVLDQTYHVLESVYNTLSDEKLKEYDLNRDGYVDSIFLVYLAPTSTDLFWAFQFYWNKPSNQNKPVFSTYAWASYEFMYEESGFTAERPDAHTFIHESGHLFGLDDYYDYDKENTKSPLGGNDMMDFNITDHNMHSKYLFNWSQPYVAVGNSDITLRPAEQSGDFVLLNKSWNGHVYDEYILIEYYTPTGLNFKDSVEGYGAINGFTVPGVRIFHVDARLQTVYSDTDKRWTDEIMPISNQYYTDYATSNTGSRSVNPAFKRIHLLDGAGRANTWYHQAVRSDNNALFKPGQKIEINNWKKYLFHSGNFNDGSEIGFSVEIGVMTPAGVDIKIRVT